MSSFSFEVEFFLVSESSLESESLLEPEPLLEPPLLEPELLPEDF